MVKKVGSKKDEKGEKGPPKDQFDPLLVESSQAATVVLMLQSEEEEILLRSMEALYKFVQKCDDNKRLLWDLRSVPLLLKHLQSDNKNIHRNACMVLGLMSCLREVQLYFKKTEETVPTLIRLLSVDEEAVVHEYATLCLLNIAKHYIGICQIRENNGIEPLIRCLSSPDQDIKNYSIETIFLMMDDYQSRTAVRQLNGLPAILELLKSEYPVIQHKALCSLLRITEEVDNRTALRDLGAMAQFVDFIGTSTYREFHVLAVNILSNCFEDVETIRVIKENGVLSRLIAIVTDAPPPPPPPSKQEGKKEKKEKTPRAGKKGKGEKNPSVVALSDQPAPVMPTLPEVKEHISWAVWRCAKNAEIRKLLQANEIEKMLIIFLAHCDAKVQIAASQALRVMAENLLSRECTGKYGGIPPLIKMITDQDDDVKEAALTVLNILTVDNDFNCFEISKSGGTKPLLCLLSTSCRDVTISNVLGTLINMAKEEELRYEILANNLISGLINPLSSENTDVQAKVALAVATFVLKPLDRRKLIELNGILPLVLVLDSSNDEVRRNCTKAITVLAADTPTAEEICRLGGLDVLRNLQISGITKNLHIEEAIMRLLEHNLSAKYALVGKLCTNDVITDGFYDVGKIQPGNRFLPLAEYDMEPVNGGRPIFVVYAPCEMDEKEEVLAETVDGCLEKPKTCDTGPQNVDPCQDDTSCVTTADPFPCRFIKPPPQYEPNMDCCLLQCIDEMRITLKPFEFCNLHERVVILAKFVAEKMGGPLERGKLSDFSWELPISQLKYQLQSNVIPIGSVMCGIHYHRALLFKVIGDRVKIPSSLVRGECNLAWNEVYIEEKPMHYPKYPAKIHIVDLVYEPGRLMSCDSPAAAAYVTP